MIIGCGGTGSRLVPLVSQFIKTCSWVANPEIVLVDDDVVESKNLLRQNFIKSDVDRNKAVVLANRYSKAFDIQITPITTRVKDVDSFTDRMVGRKLESESESESGQEIALLDSTFSRFISNSIVVMCVDSPEARRSILMHLMRKSPYTSRVLVIDAGNENDYGQVTCSTLNRPTFKTDNLNGLPKNLPGDLEIPCIPTDLSYFKGMTAISTGSCADLDQTMAINTAMATTIFNLIQNFYYAKPIGYHRIDVSLSHGSIPQYMNVDWVKHMEAQKGELSGYHLSPMDISPSITKFRKDIYEPFLAQVKKAEEQGKAEIKAEVNKTAKTPTKKAEVGEVKTEDPTAPPVVEDAEALW